MDAFQILCSVVAVLFISVLLIPAKTKTYLKGLKIGKIFKATVVIVVIILTVLLVTNPTYNDFRNFIPVIQRAKSYYTIRRVHNYFIFSMYSYYKRDYANEEKKYVGFMGGFYEIKN